MTHDGEVLVFATDHHWQSDAAKRLCVSYDPIPLQDDKVPKMPTRKRGPTSGWTVSAPIEVDKPSDISRAPKPACRPVAPADSGPPRAGPSQRFAAQTSLAVDDDRLSLEMDSNPDPIYDTSQLYPSPIRPRQPVVFSPLQVPEELLGRKRRRVEQDIPAHDTTRQPSVQRVIADLPRGSKRKLGAEEPNALLPAFNDRRAPSRREVSVHRAPSDPNRRGVSGEPWSHPPPDRFPVPSRARSQVREVSIAPRARQLAPYGRPHSYVRDVSREPIDRPRQFSRAPMRAFSREDTRYAPYEIPTQMDYLQPQDDRRYRDDVLHEDPREYAPRYIAGRDYLDQNGDRYGPGEDEELY